MSFSINVDKERTMAVVGKWFGCSVREAEAVTGSTSLLANEDKLVLSGEPCSDMTTHCFSPVLISYV